MKKLLVLTCLLFAVHTIIAQEDDPRTQYDNYVGIRAGVNYTGLTESPFGFGQSGQITPNIGIYSESRFFNSIYLVWEANYSGKGGDFEDEISEGELNLSYLDMPLMLAWYPTQTLGLQFGVLPSFFLAGNYSRPEGFEGGDATDLLFHRMTVGLVLGVNLRVTDAINVDFKYNPLNSLLFDLHTQPQLRPNTATLRIGYSFIREN
ncbi:porin family protein [Cytophagaceae bacterium ABcell3]|nr:porin family protein [Cytophagaceae bacterium ABcell3]